MSRSVGCRRNRSDESGFVAVEFVLGLGVLLLPVALLVMVFPIWSERQEMARVAAREAARIYALTGNTQQADDVVQQIEQNYHLKDDGLTLDLKGDPRKRGGEVTAVIHVKVPATNIPLLHANADAFSFTEQHSEVIDLYRSMPTP